MSEPFQQNAATCRIHWRRLFQFRLQTLLILTTIIAVWLGWWSYKARQQREAVAALEKIGAILIYDYRLPGTSGMNDSPKWSSWLSDNIGVDYFASVNRMWFSNREVTDAELEPVKNLSALHNLTINSTQITDAGLEHLKGLNALLVISVIDTKVTDAGLEHLKGLNNLEMLYLTNTQVTDAGIVRLQKALPNCKIVSWSP